MSAEAPYGSWTSPITAERVVEGSVSLGGPAYGAGDLWWSELRPSEGGRVQIVRKALDAPPEQPGVDVLPEGFGARTRVHEYGGGAWWLGPEAQAMGDTLFFANWADQRVYRIDRAGTDDASAPIPLTAAPAERHALRYADGEITPDGRFVVCVRESHGVPGTTEARNEIVAFRADCDGATFVEPAVLVGGEDGPDFVSSPRVSPDGSKLLWLEWDFPNMPWDDSRLGVAGVSSDVGSALTVNGVRRQSHPSRLFSQAQPSFSPSGIPYVVSDMYDGWWRLSSTTFDPGPIVPGGAEWAQPQWVFGQSWYAIAPDGTGIVACQRRFGSDRLSWIRRLDLSPPEVEGSQWAEPLAIDLAFSAIEGVVNAGGRGAAFIASSFVSEAQVVSIDDPGAVGPIKATVHRPARDLGIGTEWFSEPESIDFDTPDDGTGITTAHAFYYPPHNPDFHGPSREKPPLIVMSHGGPTSAARPQLSLAVQFWTSRGFGVVDVNYRGSTGYGRAYREALNKNWGIVDVDDCIAAARHLVERGDVDPQRLVIRGSSAGGYTTLCALTFHDDFAAGCSLYGVADLEALATDTHKFESRYLDGLVGPYPEQADLYRERSPIHHTDKLDTPMLILQGLDDEIVPPAQAEMMAGALRAKGVPFAYLPFEGEQHGFRQATNIRRALEAELYFYAQVLGFELAGTDAETIEPVIIEGIERLAGRARVSGEP